MPPSFRLAFFYKMRSYVFVFDQTVRPKLQSADCVGLPSRRRAPHLQHVDPGRAGSRVLSPTLIPRCVKNALRAPRLIMGELMS